MMETVVGVSKQQPYSPHLKKVLKTYQLSAVKSLQGPSTLLGTGTVSGMDKIAVSASATSSTLVTLVPKKEPVPEVVKVAPPTTSAPECGDVFMTPPPFPIQQLPILTTPDQSRSELSETVLEGETISCFVVGGEKRLCLPQVLNSVLREFSLYQINQVCEELQIFCSRCNPEQLEVLKVTGILPMTAPSCGLITKTDAERLSSALLHRSGVHVAKAPSGGHKGALSFKVYHECFGKCKGICTPELYTDNNAHCIECVECHGMFSPQKFVCHVHQFLENRTCHWGFDSSNWRSYLLIAKDQEEHEKLAKVLDEFKEQHDNTANNSQHKRKQTYRWQGSTENSYRTASRKRILEEEILHTADATDRWEKIHQPESDSKEPHELQVLKKPKLDAAAEPYGTYLYPVADPQNHILWYESWSRMSAFRPWPSIHTKEGKGQPPPPSVVRESLPTSVPTYLSHSPPVLLHPERVVPMSESERFEPCFQPNVALAPIPQQHRSRIETTKMEVKMEDLGTELDKKPKKSSGSPVSPSSAVPAHDAHSLTATTTATSAIAAAGGPTLYNPEIELSTDTDDSSSDMTTEPAPVRKECKSLVDEVVAVLGNLDDTRDAARDRVVKIVEDLAMRLELQETKTMELQEENEELRQLCLEHGIRRFNSHRMGHITELRHPIKQDPDIIGGTQGRHNRMPSTGGSPVSVITSPPPVVKSEPASSE